MSPEYIPTLEDARKIVKEFLPEEKGIIKKIDREGGDSIVFSVGDNYILRTCCERNNYDAERAILELGLEHGVKVPKVVAVNVDLDQLPFSFSLQEKLQGIPLEVLPLDLWPQVFHEVGEEMAKLYEINVPGFGQIDLKYFRETGTLKGESNSWFEFINTLFESRKLQIIAKIKKDKENRFEGSKLNVTQIDKLLEISSRCDEIDKKISKLATDVDKASILHGDLHREHFIVNNRHLTGIIDFNKTWVGDPLFDIAYASIMSNGEKFYKNLLKGSRVKMNEDNFHLYRLMLAFGKIYTRYIQFDYLHEHSDILDFALEELNK